MMHTAVERRISNTSYIVSFDPFPDKTSPFHEFLKEARLYTFAQLFAVYHDNATYRFLFDEVTVKSQDGEPVRELQNATVDERFDASTVFDHVVSSVPYVAHDAIDFGSYRVVGEKTTYEPNESLRLELGDTYLLRDQENTIITSTALHTDDEDVANLVTDAVQRIKTYFKHLLENAKTGVSHKHYVFFLLESFPGQIRVRQLPAMYTELEPYKRRARSIPIESTEAWKDLAEDVADEVEGLNRELSNDEKHLVCSVYQRSHDERFIDKAMAYLNDDPDFFASNHADLVMRVIDTARILDGETQRYNSLNNLRADNPPVEVALHEEMRGRR